MKVFKLFLTVFFISVYSLLYAQNPYESLGIKDSVLTYSKGKYKEIQENDTLVRIGSVVINMVTNEIAYFIKTDTIMYEAKPAPEIISRWLSPDPIRKPYESPYAGFANNPIVYIDPDGRDPVDPRTGQKYSISLRSAVVYTHDFNPSIHSKVTDQDLLEWSRSKFVDFMISRDSQDDAMGGGAEWLRRESATAYTSEGAVNQLKSLLPGTHPKMGPTRMMGPDLEGFQQAAAEGTYSFIDDNNNDNTFLVKNKSYNIVSVIENKISRIVNLQRNESTNSFDINTVTNISAKYGELYKKNDADGNEGLYRNVTVTETTQKYSNNKKSGNATSKTYSREEKFE